MGLPDSYRLPEREMAAWRVIGDGVAVPVVRWLAATLLEPLLAGSADGRAGEAPVGGRSALIA
jgi:DNA (cytosine-5)-methyltransferase 1